jgi:hypothetical protein
MVSLITTQRQIFKFEFFDIKYNLVTINKNFNSISSSKSPRFESCRLLSKKLKKLVSNLVFELVKWFGGAVIALLSEYCEYGNK